MSATILAFNGQRPPALTPTEKQLTQQVILLSRRTPFLGEGLGRVFEKLLNSSALAKAKTPDTVNRAVMDALVPTAPESKTPLTKFKRLRASHPIAFHEVSRLVDRLLHDTDEGGAT